MTAEVVIVGGGIAGGTLAVVLSRAGFEVLVLERETVYPDRVRGEFIPPWGVAEFKRLGLLDALQQAGGLITTKFVPYGETLSQEEAEQRPLDLTKMHPDASGSLCIGHPKMCELLASIAISQGVTFLRGVREIDVKSGSPPEVSYLHDGNRLIVKPKLVVGADGRNSVVRKRLGFGVNSDAPHNLLGGMLVGNMGCWPRDVQTLGVEGTLHFLIFPQGEDRLRLYAGYQFADRARFSGADKQTKMLRAFQSLSCIPFAEQFATAVPLGPFNSYSNEDTWIDEPIREGVVLIGDAAGHNDPIIGQGKSIAARDVRLVSDILIAAKGSNDAPSFAPYVDERSERMRRLRIAGRLASKIRVEFGPEESARRARVAQRTAERQLSPVPATLIGPERLPPEAYATETIERFIA